MKNPPSLEQLVSALKVLPGVGPKSAQRLAFHLMQRDQQGAKRLARAIDHALSCLGHCTRCNTFSENTVCNVCADHARRTSLLCVVEMPTDLLALEQTHCYDGLYFVLLGRVCPLDGLGPKEIHFDKLLDRALDGTVEEVILATNFTAEGEITAHLIGEMLKKEGLKVTRLARGIPLGGELEYLDLGTLAQALHERRTKELDVE